DGWSARVSSAWPSAVRIEPRRRSQFWPERAKFDRLATAPDQQIPTVVDGLVQAVLAFQSGSVFVRYGGEPRFPPMIDDAHEMPGKAFNQSIGVDISKAFIFQRGRELLQIRVATSHGHHADHRTEYQPRRQFEIG